MHVNFLIIQVSWVFFRFSCSFLFFISNIQVVVNGACTPVGKAAISAITKARGMELGGAVDTSFIGMDAGEVLQLLQMFHYTISVQFLRKASQSLFLSR